MTVTQNQHPSMRTYTSMQDYQMNSSNQYNKSGKEKSQVRLQEKLRKYNLPAMPSLRQILNIKEVRLKGTASIQKNLVAVLPHLTGEVLAYFDEWLAEEMRRIDPNDRKYDPNYVKSLDKHSCPGISFVFSNSHISDDAKKEKLRKFLDAVYPLSYIENHSFLDDNKFEYIINVFEKIFMEMGNFGWLIKRFLMEEISKKNQVVLFLCSTKVLDKTFFKQTIAPAMECLRSLDLPISEKYSNTFLDKGYHYAIHRQKAVAHFEIAVQLDAKEEFVAAETLPKAPATTVRPDCDYKAEAKSFLADRVSAKADSKGGYDDEKNWHKEEVVEAIVVEALNPNDRLGNREQIKDCLRRLEFCQAWSKHIGYEDKVELPYYLERVQKWLN